MALIKCPECGKEISDKANTCINCGCPIAEIRVSGTVAIAINVPAIVKIYVIDMKTRKELWCGNSGSVARFDVEKETEISIVGVLEKNYPERGTKAVVSGGKKYEYKQLKTFWSTQYTLNEIDVFDSGR